MKAFSLTEILVVIAIIGILSGVVLSSVKSSGTSQSPSVVQAFDVQVPEATNYAVDSAGVLSATDLDALNTKLKSISDSGKEIAVLTVKSTAPNDIAAYGIAVGDKWKVGKSGKDNGVILIVATVDRKIRIEVGHGAEADITDSQASHIISDVIAPHLKSGDWAGGINAGVDAINSKLK